MASKTVSKNILIECKMKDWKQSKPVCFFVMKLCIDKFISKKKKVPVKLLQDYKEVPESIRKFIGASQKQFNDSNGESDLKELFLYAYREYKNETNEPFMKVFTQHGEVFKNFNFSDFIKTQAKTDIGFSYIQHVKDFRVFDIKEIGEQFKEFKGYIKDGRMRCIEENKQTHTLGSANYYSVCFQELPLDKNNIDYGALHAFKYHVSGYVYFFHNKKNRDKMFDYVNSTK